MIITRCVMLCTNKKKGIHGKPNSSAAFTGTGHRGSNRSSCLFCTGACLPWDANYHPPQHRPTESYYAAKIVYTFARLNHDREMLKTYANEDRHRQINELYFRWERWLTDVMTWLNGSDQIPTASEPWCIF